MLTSKLMNFKYYQSALRTNNRENKLSAVLVSNDV